MVGVAFGAAGFGVAGAGSVAGLAGGDAGDEDVGRFGAAESFLMTAGTGKAAMGIVIEFCMGKPSVHGVGSGDFGKCRR